MTYISPPKIKSTIVLSFVSLTSHWTWIMFSNNKTEKLPNFFYSHIFPHIQGKPIEYSPDGSARNVQSFANFLRRGAHNSFEDLLEKREKKRREENMWSTGILFTNVEYSVTRIKTAGIIPYISKSHLTSRVTITGPFCNCGMDDLHVYLIYIVDDLHLMIYTIISSQTSLLATQPNRPGSRSLTQKTKYDPNFLNFDV